MASGKTKGGTDMRSGLMRVVLMGVKGQHSAPSEIFRQLNHKLCFVPALLLI